MSVRLRPLLPQDAASLAALHARVYPGSPWRSPAAFASYALEMLFRNPWIDPEIPSWAAEEDGRLIAVLGVVPRRMRFGARAIRVAVGCQFMVDPDRRAGLIALELLRRFFAGPQDLSLADGANDASRKLWEASGGFASALHSIHWVRFLRPALRHVSMLAKPFATLADAFAGLKGFKSDLREEPLDAAKLARVMQEQKAFALRPDYDPASIEWLLAQASAKRRYGSLEGALARDSAGRDAGWFLYYLNRGISQVLQVGARRGALPMVLDHLALHARRRGARALEGRMEPALIAALQAKRVLLQSRSIWTLLHARDQSLLVPFLRGDAFFSRLDGEWWMRFAGEPEEPVSSSSASFTSMRSGVQLPHVGA